MYSADFQLNKVSMVKYITKKERKEIFDKEIKKEINLHKKNMENTPYMERKSLWAYEKSLWSEDDKLIISVQNGNIEEVYLSLQNKANPNAEYKYTKYCPYSRDDVYFYDSAMEIALNGGKYSIAALLVSYGAKVSEEQITSICENLIENGKQDIVTGLFYKTSWSDDNTIKDVIYDYSDLQSYVERSYTFGRTEENYKEHLYQDNEEKKSNIISNISIKSEKQQAQEEYLKEHTDTQSAILVMSNNQYNEQNNKIEEFKATNDTYNENFHNEIKSEKQIAQEEYYINNMNSENNDAANEDNIVLELDYMHHSPLLIIPDSDADQYNDSNYNIACNYSDSY